MLALAILFGVIFMIILQLFTIWRQYRMDQAQTDLAGAVQELTDVLGTTVTDMNELIADVEAASTSGDQAAMETAVGQLKTLAGNLKTANDAADAALTPPVAQPTTFAITNTDLPAATVGAAYNAQILTSGGVAPVSLSMTGLPDGLQTGTSGLISGAPAADAVSGEVQIVATDSSTPPQTANASLELTVEPAAA